MRKKRVSGKKKEAESKHVEKEKTPKPTGAPPIAVVDVRHRGVVMQRHAKGFSPGEVAQAGMSFGLARRWGLHVDDRRRSVFGGNVASLKKWSSPAKKTPEQRMEVEAKKIEKAVGEEMRKVEKEVKKEVKKVEKKAAKAEKEIVEKVEAPVKKRAKKKAEKSKTS